MPSRKDSSNRNETFGRLLSGAINSIATYEGKTAPIVEEELGALAIVAGKTVQRYKAGHLPPEHETVKILAEAAIRRGYLGREWLQRCACAPAERAGQSRHAPAAHTRQRAPNHAPPATDAAKARRIESAEYLPPSSLNLNLIARGWTFVGRTVARTRSHATFAFLDALTQEMIPFIDANYRTIPSDRCLFGYSSSGFFVLYALFHQPDAFQRYLCGSGDLYIAYPYVIHHAAQLAARDAATPIQLYLSAGELEDDQFPFFHQLVALFAQGNYPGVTLTTEIYAGEGHGSEGVALTYLHGLRMVYPKVER